MAKIENGLERQLFVIPHSSTLIALSWNKLNVFHWHMLDSTSFPYVSKKYPELAAKGAYSPRHVYTAKDIKHIVQYAKERGVRVIPEMEAPGHSTAWGYGTQSQPSLRIIKTLKA